MSTQMRQELVDSPKTVFQNEDAMHRDLIAEDGTGVQSEHVATLHYLVFDKGWSLEFTMIRTGHHDDTDLNPRPPFAGTHFHGWASDLWPLASNTPGAYLPATDPRFQQFLKDVATAPFYMQTGLVGDGADSVKNFAAAGPKAFQDDGGPHVHIGSTP